MVVISVIKWLINSTKLFLSFFDFYIVIIKSNFTNFSVSNDLKYHYVQILNKAKISHKNVVCNSNEHAACFQLLSVHHLTQFKQSCLSHDLEECMIFNLLCGSICMYPLLCPYFKYSYHSSFLPYQPTTIFLYQWISMDQNKPILRPLKTGLSNVDLL